MIKNWLYVLSLCAFFGDFNYVVSYDEDKNVRVHIATWNVASQDPPEDLTPLLGLDEHPEPEIIVIGLQEITMRPDQALFNGLLDDKWTKVFESRLALDGYKKIATERLIGLAINVFVKKKLANSIKGIGTQERTTGSHGLYGNKGAVAAYFNIYSKSIRFVNCHLPAHDHGYKKRLEDYKDIRSWFTPRHPFDYEFWFGDLNFRLNNPALKGDEIRNTIKQNNLSSLIFLDQLNWARNQGVIFSDFEEGEIKFAPTFKFYRSTDEYNLKRRPAWTDRILYRKRDGLEQLKYSSHPEYQVSDHKPVTSVFVINLS